MQKSVKEARFNSVYPIDRALSGATTPGQSGPGSNGNEGVLRIPKAPALLGPHHEGVLPLCRCVLSVFYSPNRLCYTELMSKQFYFR